jgi:hypothetical protein
VHSLPVNNGGLLKQATRAGLVRKPTSLSKKLDGKQGGESIKASSGAVLNNLPTIEIKGSIVSKHSTEMKASIDGSFCKLNTKDNPRESLDLPESTNKFNNSTSKNHNKIRSQNITLDEEEDAFVRDDRTEDHIISDH